MQRSPNPRTRGRLRLLLSLALVMLTLATAGLVVGEGTGTIYRGVDPARFRTTLEWRSSEYGGGDSPEFRLLRRTVLLVYAQANEQILLGSSAIGVPDGAGDIVVYRAAAVSGDIGQETFLPLGDPILGEPGAFTNGFSCNAQRDGGADPTGRIANVTQEAAGPLPATGGYTPCVYTAPATEIYAVAFSGPDGPAVTNNDRNPRISGQLLATEADFGLDQRTGVTAWDVTVRNDGANQPGRLFTYYYAGTTGGGARRVGGQVYVVTDTGFIYRVFFDGDPFGFVFYANQLGFQDGDGLPLYRNLMADPAFDFQTQNQLRQLQGGVSLLPPEYPIFIAPPDPLVLTALDIPLAPIAPEIRDFGFTGAGGPGSTTVDTGGTFSLFTTQPGVYYVVISRDGTNFDPTEPTNRVIRDITQVSGTLTIAWDGRDNQGVPFPPGDFTAGTAVQGGEVHFPMLDVENNLNGGPSITLANPPDATGDGQPDCPPWNGGCSGAFYDDRGYRTTDDIIVGTAVNGPLCPGNVGNPPDPLFSDPILGFDTTVLTSTDTTDRAFGFPVDANPDAICDVEGGFGDKKGLDIWTFYPSNALTTPLQIVDPTVVTLRSFTASRGDGQVVVRWETGLELDTQGFHLLRGTGDDPDEAVRVTGAPIAARGGPSGGAGYSWTDTGASEATATYSYWLQELESGGATRLYGPARTSGAPAQGSRRVLIPVISR